MNTQTVINTIAQLHNILTEISVKGADAIRMAQVLTTTHDLVQKLKEEQNKTQEEQEVN